jgi:hypothetical protein
MGSASNEEREVRAARNQALLRIVNEQIKGFGEFVGTVSITCECSRIDCVDLLEIEPLAHGAIHESPRTFAVLADHVEAGVDRVVSSHDGYAVVEVEEQHACRGADLSRRTANRRTPEGVSR